MKKIISFFIIAMMAFVAGCTRIETGEVGLRVNFNKTVELGELQPGSLNQTVIGDVMTFQVKDVSFSLENKNPLTADNTPLSDFDLSVVYSINPQKVAEIYTTKNRSYHAADSDGDVLLMYNRVATLVNNEAYKAVRQYPALEVVDKRQEIEKKIVDGVKQQLEGEGLGDSITVSQIEVRNALPNQQILAAATEYVRAQNELKIKATEVAIAQKESERMAALASQGQQSIAYMQAKAQLNISEGILHGKVNTIVVPQDFKGIVNTGR